MGCLALVTALAAAFPHALAAGDEGLPLLTEPSYGATVPYLGVPPWLESRVVYYNGFSRPDGAAELGSSAVEVRGRPLPTAAGFLGPGGTVPTQEQALHLVSPAFSPHRPVSFMVWWALTGPHQPGSCFGIIHLQGRGIVSLFSRGKGEWCALERPAGVFQVYYFPGIQSVNGIYDSDLASHLDLRPGVWHHSAVVISAASLCEVYTDGKLSFNVRIAGRNLEEGDGLADLTFGSPFPMALDEALVLNRALSAAEVEAYWTATHEMHQAGY
jgi:hypothetical protein